MFNEQAVNIVQLIPRGKEIRGTAHTPRNNAISSVLSVLYASDKTLTKSNLRKKGFIWLMHPDRSLIPVGSQAGQEPGSRNVEAEIIKEHAIDLLLLSHLSALFTQLRPTDPRMELSSGDLALFQLLTIKTMLYRHLHRPIWWKQFLNWDSLLSNMYRFLSCWQNLTTTPKWRICSAGKDWWPPKQTQWE